MEYDHGKMVILIDGEDTGISLYLIFAAYLHDRDGYVRIYGTLVSGP